MSGLHKADIKKAYYYLKRNGLRDTFLAALERLQMKRGEKYVYEAPDGRTLMQQKKRAEEGFADSVKFSILVPAYHTKESFFCAMAESVLKQSYGCFELVIADAGAQKKLEDIIKGYGDDRLRYLALDENRGISENTNKALAAARGDYIGLLDHDDMLAPDALYEMADAISRAKKEGVVPKLLYSDEDKCDESGEHYYEPHRKPAFNLDLLLSNNYICHFMVMEAGLMKKLGLQKAYDGAQDFDLALRAAGSILGTSENGQAPGRLGVAEEKAICHIPKVLYHWRCHGDSTAANPQSKQYAYEAGERAIAAFLRDNGLEGSVKPTKHLGFYRVRYGQDVFHSRADIGIIGGKLLRNNKITGGIYDADGICPYEGLYKDFGGYLHRASLIQDAYAVDIRRMRVRTELRPMVKSILEENGYAAGFLADGMPVWNKVLPPDSLCRQISMEICRRVQSLGYRILWIPDWIK